MYSSSSKFYLTNMLGKGLNTVTLDTVTLNTVNVQIKIKERMEKGEGGMRYNR